MFCPNCGAPNDTQASHCGSCGTQIGLPTSAAPMSSNHDYQGQQITQINPHRGWSIGVLLMGMMCCNPLALILGIIAVVQSGKAQSAVMNGDLQAAQSAASTAKTCALIATILIPIGMMVNCGTFAAGGFDDYQQQLDVNF